MNQELTSQEDNGLRNHLPSLNEDELERVIFATWFKGTPFASHRRKSLVKIVVRNGIRLNPFRKSIIKIKNRYGRKLACLTFDDRLNLARLPGTLKYDTSKLGKHYIGKIINLLDSKSTTSVYNNTINSLNLLGLNTALNTSNQSYDSTMDDSSWVSVTESDKEVQDSKDKSLAQSLAGIVNNHLIHSFSLLGKDIFESLPNVSKQLINAKREGSVAPPPLVYIGNGYYKPSRIIKPCYAMSIDNLHRWYLMTRTPNNINAIIDNEEITNSLVSNVYYPFGNTDGPLSVDELGCDFSIQFVHPSIRKHLFTANDPSYFYLFQESISKSETSFLARALLSAERYRKKSKINEKELQTVENDNLNHEDPDSIWSLVTEMTDSNDHPKSMTMPYSDAFIGISMCPGGFFIPYHLGVLSLFSEHNVVNITTPLAGSSAGAIAAVSAGMGANFYQMMNITEGIIENLRLHGIKHRLNQALYQILSATMPSDSPEFLNNRIGSITCCCTLMTPIPKAMYTSEYYDKQDLIQCIVASSNIPMYSGKSPTVKFRGANCIDGLFSSRRCFGSPPTGSKRDIVISSFHALKFGIITGLNDCVSPHLAGLDSLIEQYLKLKSLQKRFLCIKYNLRSDYDEWKAFVQEAHMLYKRISDRCDDLDMERDIELQTHDLIVLTKHMSRGQIRLFKQVLQDSQMVIKLNLSYNVFMDFRNKIAGNPLTSDAIRQFVARFGLEEWLSLEIERLNGTKIMEELSLSETDPSQAQFTSVSVSEDNDSHVENEYYKGFDAYAGQIESIDCQVSNPYESVDEQYSKIDTLSKSESIATVASNLRRKIKKLRMIIKCISSFLCFVFPPNKLSYYYTNSCTMLSHEMSPSQIYNFALKGSSLEDVRQMFDQGRADAFRWIILEYILLENYLYQKLGTYNRELEGLNDRLIRLVGPSEFEAFSDLGQSINADATCKCETSIDCKRCKKGTSNKTYRRPLFNNSNKKHNRESNNILKEQINYINNVLGPPDDFEKIIGDGDCGKCDNASPDKYVTAKYEGEFKPSDIANNTPNRVTTEGSNHSQDKAAMDYLFKRQNCIIKQTIRLNILKDSDFMHILTHTGHWINSAESSCII